MRFDTSQFMKMGQHMKLAPHMIQSMEILQMSLAELEERIEQELENNATLEVAEPGMDDEPGGEQEGLGGGDDGEGLDGGVDALGRTAEERPMRVDEDDARADFERLGEFEDTNPEIAENNYEAIDQRDYREAGEYEPRTSGNGDGVDAKSEAMNNTAARDMTPTEQLLEQWDLADVEPALGPLGRLLIGYIEDDGYIRTELPVIAEKAVPAAGWEGPKPTVEQLERALRAVQMLLEPPGIGARSPKECLLLQIDAMQAEKSDGPGKPGTEANWGLMRTLVEHHLEDLAQNRLPKVAQKTGVSLEQLRAAIDKLRTLSLAPGRRLIRASEPGIVADAFVEYDPDGDRYYAYLNERRLPNLRINQEYARLSKDRQAPKPTRDFIKTNLSNAQFLLDAIEQRKRTLLRVVQAVVDAQREYFDYGPQALRPLPMTKVAEQLGVHVATVSRAVSEKYLQTPRGVVPLRKFFTGGTTNEDGEEVSWDAVKAALLEVIAGEDKAKPLSDDQLVEELKKRGLEIARRTVAKYRSQLNIPTGRLRKVH